MNLLKTALLLWDKIEYIVPDEYIRARSNDKNVQEALEVISFPHQPTSEEKRLAHNQIVDLVKSGLPKWFMFFPENEKLIYDIYPPKFLQETWEVIREYDVFKPSGYDINETHRTNKYFGLTMMSILADCCAGTQKRTVTDEIDSYAALTRYITASHEGEYGQISEDHERLATISLKVIDAEGIDFERLIDLRRQEVAKNDDFLRSLRHNYLEAIDRYVKRITQEARHDEDRREIERVFEQEMSDDFARLKKRLGYAAKDVLLSKEVAVSALAIAGIFVEPITLPSGLISVGALLKAKNKYSEARKKALGDHAMAWLYTAKYQHPVL